MRDRNYTTMPLLGRLQMIHRSQGWEYRPMSVRIYEDKLSRARFRNMRVTPRRNVVTIPYEEEGPSFSEAVNWIALRTSPWHFVIVRQKGVPLVEFSFDDDATAVEFKLMFG